MVCAALRGALVGLAFAAVAPALAQLAPPTLRPIVGMRSLSLSDDGERLAFGYRGDLWVVSSQGGRATPLTTHVEYESNPVWSPDGAWVAFASNRSGNTDIYAVPSDGGDVRRLTWHTGSDVPTDWSPDGTRLLMAATRDSGYNGLAELNVANLRLTMLTQDMVTNSNPAYSPDGNLIVYQRLGFPWVRPRYAGSAAAQLWVWDRTTGQRRLLRSTERQHLWPRFGPNGRVYVVTTGEVTPSTSPLGRFIPKIVDNPDRTPNVWEISLDGRARRLTSFEGGGVRFLTVARRSGLIAFEYEGHVYTMRPGEAPKKITITATLDDRIPLEERLILTSGVDGFAANAKGDQVVFTLRGELWSVPVEKTDKGPNKDDARQLTAWAGLDQEPVFAPDGKAVFFTSDRDGSQRVYRLDLESREVTPVSKADHDCFDLQLTPDKKNLSFWMAGLEGGLFVVPVEGGEPKRLFALTQPFGSAAWSPDSRYVAYATFNTRRALNVFVFDTETGQSVNVTRLNAGNRNPAWSADGKYLYFVSNRQGDAIYLIPLQPEDRRDRELLLEYKKPDGPVKVEIDFQDIDQRIRRFIGVGGASDLLSDPATGDLYFLSGGDLWQAKYNGDNPQRITNGGGVSSFFLGGDGNRLFLLRNGEMQTMNIRNPQRPTSTITFRADWTRDLRAERLAAFMQFWRGYNRSFYDPNFHGRDWTRIRERYLPLMDGVGHRNDMAILLGMMVGELEASHAEVSPGPGGPPSQSSAHPGFTFDYGWAGPGIRVASVPPGSPASFRQTLIRPGEYVLAINGKDVTVDEALWRDVLNEQAGREITLLVSPTPGRGAAAREVKYRALSAGEWNDLLYRNLINARIKRVEERSRGRIAYIHISGMGGNDFERFEREVWERVEGKEAAIIDVRNNGGGNISDRIVDILERRTHTFFRGRDSVPIPTSLSWELPTVVIHAESSASNAEMFPWAMKDRGLAVLVGKRTPGYVIGTFGFPLIDGTNARMPTSGVFRRDGSNMENDGQRPDIEVEITPEQFFRGEDPQLDRAIDVLLEKIGR